MENSLGFFRKEGKTLQGKRIFSHSCFNGVAGTVETVDEPILESCKICIGGGATEGVTRGVREGFAQFPRTFGTVVFVVYIKFLPLTVECHRHVG